MLPATWPLVMLPSAPKVGAVMGCRNSSEDTSRLMLGNSSMPWLVIVWPMVAFRVWSSAPASAVTSRSEEHTSELQSLRHLVCRLLLEKKKKKKHHYEKSTQYTNTVRASRATPFT